MAREAVGLTYHRLHHFLTEATWSAALINDRRLEVMNKCSQTRISRGFSLIVDDSGHRKSAECTPLSTSKREAQLRQSAKQTMGRMPRFEVGRGGNFTAGVGRQYIGKIGKTDNGNVVVTTHLYDGKKSLPHECFYL